MEDFRQWKTSSLMSCFEGNATNILQCFQKWKRPREKCIAAQVDYFEGGNVQQALSREKYYLLPNFMNFLNILCILHTAAAAAVIV
jgi:hypothetical protein